MAIRVVMDTNVLVSALRSNKGASFRLLSLVGHARFQLCLSVPIVLEYEAAAKKQITRGGLTITDVDAIIDYLCKVGEHYQTSSNQAGFSKPIER
jgi:predicted nucleic acid-binding protein